MNYGFPYRGSKSKVAERIISILPSADILYDLFAGGGAITHCALLSGKWKQIVANDIQGTMNLFLDAVKGKYRNERRWISREQFYAEKDKDPYIRWIWSFGNDGHTYLFSKKIEEIKRLAHEFLFENGYNYTPEKRIKLIKEFKNRMKLNGRFELEQLERLERLQKLEELSGLENKLKVYSKDYREVEIIGDNIVVYCDIPYNQVMQYKERYYQIEFNEYEFYDWAKSRKFAVYFSSSFCDDTDFEEVLIYTKDCLMNNKNSSGKKKIVEKLYWNKKGLKPCYKDVRLSDFNAKNDKNKVIQLRLF